MSSQYYDPRSKPRLGARAAADIRRQHQAGFSIAELSRHHGVSRDTVSRVVKGKTYRRVAAAAAKEPNMRVKRQPPPASKPKNPEDVQLRPDSQRVLAQMLQRQPQTRVPRPRRRPKEKLRDSPMTRVD